ncbi:RNA-dependent RNA polymerase 6 [Tanacetum coccineum]
MPTEMELTLEQTQQGVSYEVSVFTMKMEILLEPTSNKLMVEHAEYDESNTYVLERFNTTAGNPVKKILLKLNLSDHRLFKDGGGVQKRNEKYLPWHVCKEERVMHEYFSLSNVVLSSKSEGEGAGTSSSCGGLGGVKLQEPALGVEDDIFWDMQMKNVMNLNQMLVDNDVAYDVITTSCAKSGNTSSIMLGAGFKPQTEPHLRGMLISIRVAQLEELREKSRIFVQDGRWLMGCLDALDVLEQGGCFIQVSNQSVENCFVKDGLKFIKTNRNLTVIEGYVVIAKNSCLHPGDIRVLKADEHLIPPSKQSWLPLEYTAAEAKELPREIRHMVTLLSLCCDFMKSLVKAGIMREVLYHLVEIHHIFVCGSPIYPHREQMYRRYPHREHFSREQCSVSGLRIYP